MFAPSWPARERRLRGVAVAAMGLALLVSQPLDLADLNPLARAANAVDQVRTLLDTDRRVATIEDARADMRATYAVPPEMLARIGDGSVHVAPYDAAVAWAYPSLEWSPLPVFQAYAAYTADLDGLNADRLASAAGPDFVLRRSRAVIDKRFEWWEAPRTMLALACRYREVLADGTWQLLERGEDRCSTPIPIGSVTVRPGELVVVPAPPAADMIVIARVHGLGDDPVERLRTILVRGSVWTLRITDGGFYRLVPGTADGPLIVGGAPGLLFDPPHGPPSPSSFTLTVGSSVGTSYDPLPETPLMIEFEAIRIGP